MGGRRQENLEIVVIHDENIKNEVFTTEAGAKKR